MSASDSTVDILLYIALKEEFDVVQQVLGDLEVRKLKDEAVTLFAGSIRSQTLGRDFKVGVVPAGKMGNVRAANITSLVLREWKPNDVVVIGIAGSVSNDLEPGDVFIPDSVVDYLANSASQGEKELWTFVTSGNAFQTSPRLLNSFEFFAHSHPREYLQWEAHAAQARGRLIHGSIEKAMASAGLPTRGKCRLCAGDDLKLASGPTVGKGTAFVKWLTREVDRKFAAMEMESAGVYDAALIRTPAPRTITIRGISDYADERKEKVEKNAKGKFRWLAAHNAVSLFVRGVEAGLFEPDTASIRLGEGAVAPATQALAKAIFVIGGVTSETTDPDAEVPSLNVAALTLGRTLAEAGAHLIICSPFPDSADYYAAMGYVKGKGPRLIHMHSPQNPRVAEKRRAFGEKFERDGVVIQDWLYPGPENEERDSWTQAWLLAQLQALERADVVIALGGKVSKSANTLLHLAEGKGVPIVPFTFLGGAALRAFNRRDWKRLNPKLDPTLLQTDEGVEKAVEIANQLVLKRTSRLSRDSKRPKTIFVSFAKKDAESGNALVDFLKSQGFEVLTGDHEVRAEQMVQASIEQAILKSNVCVVLWSRNYAVSPWCYDELILATGRQAVGEMGIWLFNLDDSRIAPAPARKLPAISARSPASLVAVARQLTSEPE
jgi:nucleoside phosphorylase